MCNRESFILLPESTGIPVAWSTSYHHEIISKQLRKSFGIVPFSALTGIDGMTYSSVQIECIGGDVKKWDWDNTPMRKEYSCLAGDIVIHPDGFELVNTRMEIKTVPDLPHWLEDNLVTYQNRVERILERLNPLRDRQDRLRRILLSCAEYPGVAKSLGEDIEVVVSNCGDSPEVKEWEAIINEYRKIEGFVYAER